MGVRPLQMPSFDPNPRPPLKIILPEGSSTSARQVLYCLGREDVVDILDPNPLCQCRFSRWVRKWYRCPHYAEDPLGYLQFLAERLRSDKYDVLLPTQEQVYLLSRVRDQLGRHVGLALPEFSALRQMQDKARFVQLLDDLDLPHPPTVVVRGAAELVRAKTFPCFVKLAHSTAGLGVHCVADRDELSQLIETLQRSDDCDEHSEILIQQPANGTLSVVFAIFQHGRMVAHQNTLVRLYGVGTNARESMDHPRVVADMERIGSHLNWHGAMFIEYFLDLATGDVQYLECNPRTGEMLNARLAGANLCEQLIRVSLGEEVEASLPPGETGVRSHQGFLIGLARALAGKSRWQILRERRAARAGRGFYEDSQDELTRPGEDWLSIFPNLGVMAQLAVSPSLAKGIVEKTVGNYSLPGAAARRIDQLTEAELASCFTNERGAGAT